MYPRSVESWKSRAFLPPTLTLKYSISAFDDSTFWCISKLRVSEFSLKKMITLSVSLSLSTPSSPFDLTFSKSTRYIFILSRLSVQFLSAFFKLYHNNGKHSNKSPEEKSKGNIKCSFIHFVAVYLAVIRT